MTAIKTIRTGQQFTFPYAPLSVYRSRGNGWYEGNGYDGGPWHVDSETLVNVVDNISDEWESHLAYRAEN